MSRILRQLMLFTILLVGLFILILNLGVQPQLIAQSALWIWTNREVVGINLVSNLFWAILVILLVAFREQLKEKLQSFFMSVDEKIKQEEKEKKELLYLDNIGVKIREEDPKWDTQFYTPLSAIEKYRLPGIQPAMILISYRLRPRLFIPKEEDADLSFIRGRRIDLMDILRKREKLVVLGAPGSGKSVTMRQLALLATEEAKRKSGARRRLPLLVNMRSYTAVSADGKPQDVISFIRQYITDKLPNYGKFLADNIDEYLSKGKLLVLFDGLNEMPSADYTERLKALKNFSGAWPRTKVIFTCRTFHYDPLFNIQEVVINPLTEKQIELFIKNYVGSHKGKNLYEELRAMDKSILFKDCRTPYFLVMILDLFNAGVPIPKTRGELFSNYVFGMVEQMARNKDIDSQSAYSEITQRLCPLAFKMNEAKLLGTEVGRGWAIEAIGHTDADRTIKLATEAGILDIAHSDKIRFAHHILQEYFASVSLSDKFSSGQDISLYLRDPWWEETIILMAGLIKEPGELVTHILANEHRSSWDLWLAARCIASAGIPSGSKVQSHVYDGINAELSSDNIFCIARGIRALGELGDERSIRSASRGLYSKSSWLQEIALSVVASSRIPAAREEIVRFFRTKAPWNKIFQYYLALDERGPILRAILLRLVLLAAFLIGLSIIFVAAGAAIFGMTALIGLDSLLSYIFIGIFPLYLIGMIVLIISWPIRYGLKAIKVLLWSKSQRDDFQSSLAFSWSGIMLCLLLIPSFLFLGFMMIAINYIIKYVIIAATEPTTPVSAKLIAGGILLLTFIAIVILPAGVLATQSQITSIRKILYLRKLEKSIAFDNQIFGDKWKRNLEQLIRNKYNHSVIRTRSIKLLSRIALPIEVLPLLIRLVLDETTDQKVLNSAWKAIDEIDERCRRQPKDISSEYKLVNSLLIFITARQDLTDDLKSIILKWIEITNKPSEDLDIIANEILKTDRSFRRVADVLGATEPDKWDMYWQRADTLFAKGDYASALDNLIKFIYTCDVRNYNWGISSFNKFRATFMTAVFYPLILIDHRFKLPSSIQRKMRGWYASFLIYRCITLISKGKWDTALEYCDKCIQLFPDRAFVYSNRAEVFTDIGNFDKAASDLSKAAELEPEESLVWMNYWRFYQYQGQTEKALESILRNIRKYPLLYDWYFELGISLLMLGYMEGALQAFRVSAMFKPNKNQILRQKNLLKRLVTNSTERETLYQIEKILHH